MNILSWNIQSGLGCDNIRDIYRILEYLRREVFDVICLQEVARFIPEYCPEGQPDQVEIICSALPEYTPVWGTGIHWWQPDLPPQEFGNLTLVRSIVADQRIHPLPLPAGNGYPQFPRVVTEGVLVTNSGPLRLLNTHIAYHNREETACQVEFICRLQEWEEENIVNPPAIRAGSYANRFRTASAILCGDLNLTPTDPCYRILDESPFADAWSVCQPDVQHPPTCGIHDQQTWPDGPHCRDYFWISRNLVPLITDISADQRVDLSDHQPLRLTVDLDLLTSINGDLS